MMHIRVGLLVFLLIAPAASVEAASLAQEFKVGNDAVVRTISRSDDFLKTVKLEANGVQMLDMPSVEFLVELDYKGEVVVLAPTDFHINGVSVERNERETRTSVELWCQREGLPFVMYVDYFTQPRAEYQQKAIVIKRSRVEGAVLRRIVIEDMRFIDSFVPVAPLDRYAGKSGDEPEADLSDTSTRFRFDVASDFAAMDRESEKGVYFFVTSLFGREVFTTRRDLYMSEEMSVPLSQGYETGRATIGAAAGPPEVLYKRFREFLWNNYCVMRGKPAPVEYETWINERQDVSEEKCLQEMKAMQEEGYFNAFHLDYGWENHYPLTEDKQKFPRGLPYLAEQAKSMGLRMVYWINPLGSKGQTNDSPRWGGMWDGLIKDHPDWFAVYDPEKNPVPKGDDVLCFTSPYADYVESKLLRLVNDCGAAMLYIDGGDWNVFKCPPSGPYHVAEEELSFKVISRYCDIYAKLRKANPELIICLSPQVVNLPSHAHRLNTIDQIEFWDGTAAGCLGDRQQRYNQAFIFPPYTMNAGWYMKDMALPFPQVKYVIISTISDHPQLQGTRQIVNPTPALGAYLKKFYAFRERFEPYFEVYQHVLDFPDGRSVDGEGHIIGNRGFIILFNPADQPQKIELPLEEPGLELRGDLKLSDWTELETPTSLGSARPGDKVEIELGTMSAKIIGVNIDS